jgi:threonine dehydrogenase-like Zn-dependent dehydrogenase
MKAVVVDGPRRFSIQERAVPAAAGNALVRVSAGGICGTDLKVVNGEVPTRTPVILGHEIIGQVEVSAPGPGPQAGTRVVVDPSISCGQCRVCRRDLPQLCPNGGLMGRDADGGFAALIAVSAANLHPIPDSMPAADAVMLQVMSTCVHAQSRIGVGLGDTAVVVGLGVAGLLHVRMLAVRGISRIIGVSRSPAKRLLATELGATAVAAPAQALALVAEVTDGLGADVVVECAGQPETLVQATAVAGAGASLLMFGTIAGTADEMPTYEWYRKELTLVYTKAARPRDFAAAITLVRDGLVSPGRLVTSAYPVAEIGAAIAAAARSEEIKVMLTIAG